MKGYEPSIEDLIEVKDRCLTVGIMITALLLDADFVHNNDVQKYRAETAIKLINMIAGDAGREIG